MKIIEAVRSALDETSDRAIFVVTSQGFDEGEHEFSAYNSFTFWRAPSNWKPRDLAHALAVLALEMANKEFLLPEEMAALIVEEMTA